MKILIREFKRYLNKENIIYLIFAALISAILIFAFNYFGNFNTKLDRADTSTLDDVTSLAPTTTDFYKLYDENAKYTIINYFSLDCIHCRRAYLLEDKMLSNLKGKVNIIYRHNPLASQPLSASKAVMSLCVHDLAKGDNGKKDEVYFDFIKDTFTNYDLYNANNKWVENIAYKYVNKNELNKCISEKKLESVISKIKLENTLNSIIYTPTLILFKNNPAPSGAGEYIRKYDGITENGVVNIYKWLIKN